MLRVVHDEDIACSGSTDAHRVCVLDVRAYDEIAKEIILSSHARADDTEAE